MVRLGLTLARAAARLIVDPLLAVVFPSRCPACRAAVARPTLGPLCEACWAALPRHQGPLCRCGFPLPKSAAGPCGRCRRGLQAFEAGASLGPYEGSLKAAIHELKYAGRRRVAARLAEALLHEQSVSSVLAKGAVLVAVPLHPRRRDERGFNQSELLALELARRSGHRVARSALVRRRETQAQTGLCAAARRRNVEGAFAVRRRGEVAGRVVVLVDDVSTTGATARACSLALRKAGAAEVRVLTVARVV
jgi:ComF family protein